MRLAHAVRLADERDLHAVRACSSDRKVFLFIGWVDGSWLYLVTAETYFCIACIFSDWQLQRVADCALLLRGVHLSRSISFVSPCVSSICITLLALLPRRLVLLAEKRQQHRSDEEVGYQWETVGFRWLRWFRSS